jgi:hypothetical protein
VSYSISPLLVIEGEKGMICVLAIQAALISDHVKAKISSGHWLMEEKPAETSAVGEGAFAVFLPSNFTEYFLICVIRKNL